MKKILLQFIFLCILSSTYSQAVGEWLFDDATNLTKSTIGPDLVLQGSHTAIEGFIENDGAVRIGAGSHYKLTHGITSGPGQTYANTYSFLFDFRVSGTDVWHSFLQCNGANTDDADVFVRNGAGTLGVSATGYSSKAVVPDLWYRFVVVVNNGTEYSLYLDAEKILTGTVQSIDGRFGLRNEILLFGDNDNEDGVIDISKVSLFDEALTQADVTLLGGVPKPYVPYLVKPYLQNVTTDGISVMWETSTSVDKTFQYGKTTDYGVSAEATHTYSNAGTYIYKTSLSGLEPGTSYYYKVTVEGEYESEGSFRTAPDSNNATFTFVTWGDSHYTNPFSKMVKFMVDSVNPDFGFSSGDISNTGNSRSDLASVFLPYVCNGIGVNFPFYVSLGNHDVGSSWGGGDLIRQYLHTPGAVNSDPLGFNGSYLMMYANVAFISIDWNRMETDILTGGWVETTLQRQKVRDARFRFIFIHNAPFYERWQVGENQIIKQNLPPLAEANGVDAVFSGHMHGYERGILNDVMYITQGGSSYMDSGEPLGPIFYNHILLGTDKAGNPEGFNNGLNNHFVSVHVEENKALIKQHNFTGQGQYLGVVDTVTLIGPELVSLAQYKENPVKIYNDPQSQSVRMESDIPFTYKLYSISGLIMMMEKTPGLSKKLSTADLSPGVYIVNIKSEQGSSAGKIILN